MYLCTYLCVCRRVYFRLYFTFHVAEVPASAKDDEDRPSARQQHLRCLAHPPPKVVGNFRHGTYARSPSGHAHYHIDVLTIANNFALIISCRSNATISEPRATFFIIAKEGLVMTTLTLMDQTSAQAVSTGVSNKSCQQTPATLNAYQAPPRTCASKPCHCHCCSRICQPAESTVAACMASCVCHAFSSSCADRLYMSPSKCDSGGYTSNGPEHPPSTPTYDPLCCDLLLCLHTYLHICGHTFLTVIRSWGGCCTYISVQIYRSDHLDVTYIYRPNLGLINFRPTFMDYIIC